MFFDALKAERQSWDSLYQEVADYLLPKRARFTSENAGPPTGEYDRLYDDTGPWALDQFANGLHSMLTSPLSQWFDLQVRDPAMRDRPGVREWKTAVVRAMYDQFNSSTSSFHPMVQEVYTDLGAFGYGVGYSEWSQDDGAILFQARFPGEVYLIEDQYGRVRGIARSYRLTTMQFVEAFGEDKLPQGEREKLRQGKDEARWEITHVVLPRGHPLMRGFTFQPQFAYGSVRICKKIGPEPLAVAGYRSFPFHVARWGKRTGEIYSTSPGIAALPSVRRANAMQLDLIKIVHRWADPPTQGPDDETLAPYDLSPGAQNYYRPGTNDRIEPIGVTGDPTPALRLVETTTESILRQFFVDAFLTTADSNGQNVKATFVMQRRNERFRQLASMLSRVEREFLGSIVDRVFDTTLSEGLAPPPPIDETEVLALEAEYLSPITRAQRSEVLDGFNQTLELAAVGAQFDPAVMQTFNWVNILSDVGNNIHALPASWFKTAEEVAAAQQELQAAQEMQQGAGVARDAAAAFKDVAQAARA